MVLLIFHLQSLAARQTDEEVLIKEMEETGQALEELQEQNARLLEQVRDKEDTKFLLIEEKLRLDRIKDLHSQERQKAAEKTCSNATRVVHVTIVQEIGCGLVCRP